MALIQTPGRTSYLSGDNTRDWVETYGRKNGLLNPSLVLRFATDTNYLRSTPRHLYGATNETQQTKAMFNLGLPCMRVPGVLSWSVQETDGVVQSATADILNCLPISERATTLTTALEAGAHSPKIIANYISDSLGVVQKVNGQVSGVNRDPEVVSDSHGYPYREEAVNYRRFSNQTFTVADASAFPYPQIPTADPDNDVPDSAWPQHTSGIGAYFVLLGGTEIVKVISKAGNVFEIPPGGRNVGVDSEFVVTWPVGTTVQLLGHGPYTGEWTGLGYLNVDDFRPQTALMRPGTCFTSYEGYGDIGTLSHDGGPNYAFTGYWFISGVEPSLGEDGVPKIRVDLKSAGNMFDQQKISPDILRRAKTQFGQWRVGQAQQTIWGAANHDRNIPGDWVDYNSWEPAQPSSYPLSIKVELAQHKEFYDHITEADNGNQCLECRAEHADWLKTHSGGGKNVLLEQRAIGKHIYKSSIRVLREEAGPIKTYIRLMATLAAAAWDHPAYGTELAQSFTKIPNQLFDNIRAIDTGLLFNGQITLEKQSNNEDYDWFSGTYDDSTIISRRTALTCPFESTYDKSPFSQPMLDLAEVNGNNFWVNRKGQPVFVPRNFNFRPFGAGGEWNQSYGGSISQYSHSVNPESVITQCWITATSAFDSSMTLIAGGTGWTGDKRINYGGLSGNKQGLALTSGVQQVDTISMDNQTLGLDWNTNAKGWGAVEVRNGESRQLNVMPTLYQGATPLNSKSAPNVSNSTKRIQRTINWFLARQYFLIIDSDGKRILSLGVDGKYNSDTTAGVKALQTFLRANGGTSARSVVVDGQTISIPAVNVDGTYGRTEWAAIRDYLKTHEHYIEFDIWWYVINGRPWEEYVAAITGVPITTQTGTTAGIQDAQTEDIVAAVNDSRTQEAVGEWTKTFSRSVINVGNRFIDDSINKSIVRTIASNMADPRIQPGDTIWCKVPGFLEQRTRAPFTNGIFVNNIQRTMDLQNGTYTATYGGYRFIGDNKQGLSDQDVKNGYLTVVQSN